MDELLASTLGLLFLLTFHSLLKELLTFLLMTLCWYIFLVPLVIVHLVHSYRYYNWSVERWQCPPYFGHSSSSEHLFPLFERAPDVNIVHRSFHSEWMMIDQGRDAPFLMLDLLKRAHRLSDGGCKLLSTPTDTRYGWYTTVDEPKHIVVVTSRDRAIFFDAHNGNIHSAKWPGDRIVIDTSMFSSDGESLHLANYTFVRSRV